MTDTWTPPAGYRVDYLAEVGSTNADVLKRAAAGEKSGLWLRAGRQVEGRGRRGRTWVSEEGNVYASVLVRLQPSGHAVTGLSFVAALAAHDAAVRALDEPHAQHKIGLKWPNDVLADGAKLCGILLEAQSSAGGGDGALAIGIGINVAHHPGHADYPTTSLLENGSSWGCVEVFQVLCEAFARRYDQWALGDGFSAIRGDWLDRAVGLGMPVRITAAEETIEGTFATIDEDGAIVLRMTDGDVRRFLAGDLFLSSSAA